MFITFEGIEGSGKTTQILLLGESLRKEGHDVVTTREPGGTNIGRMIRMILMDPATENLNPKAELLLYMADRAQHLEEIVKPALVEGKIVLCDRFFDSSVVYQGFVRNVARMNKIEAFHRIIFGKFKPDLTILLDLPAEKGLARALKDIESGERDDSETRFEREKIGFHESVRKGFLERAGDDSDRWVVIDAEQNKELIEAQIWFAVSRKVRGLK